MSDLIKKELASKHNTAKKIPPTGVRAVGFWKIRTSSEHVAGRRKAHFTQMCVNRHNFKTDVKPTRQCPVCHVVVDRRGYV